MFKSPEIIGHRGAAGYAPENTASAIHTAADMGLDWVELDVKLTKDYIPILFHDAQLDRTTNSSGYVKDFTWAELQELDAGFWFSEGFASEPILSLEACLDILLDRKLSLNLEIKPCEDTETETTEVVLDMVSSIWEDTNRLLISSFKPECIQITKDMAPAFKTGLILGGGSDEEWHAQISEGSLPENFAKYIQALGIEYAPIDEVLVTSSILMQLRDLSLTPIAYNVNDIDRAKELQAQGVTAFISDDPDILIEGLFSVH